MHYGLLTLLLSCRLLTTVSMEGQEPILLKLWPRGAQGTSSTKEPETTVSRPELNGTRGNIIRITNVTDPTLTVYRPAATGNSGAAIVVFPGGGYRWLAMDIEGSEICDLV